jgi:1-acyl-sn-glycerol-3-phosphate acyltransferase
VSRLHRPKAGFWIRLCVALLYPLDALLFKIRWQHLDRIPAQGGVILAVNHISHIDTILMARLVWQSGRIPRFLIKSGVFGKPIVGRVMSGAGQIPVYRGTADAQRSLEASQTALRRGECVVIYAEGTITRDPDWWPMQGKTGIARLVLTMPETPVIPIGQWGAQFTLDSGRRRFRPFPRQEALATVGDPVDLSRFRDVEPTAALLREMTNEIMSAVRDQVAILRGEPAPKAFYRGPTTPRAGDTAPGHGEPAPGHGDTPPGHGDTAPGAPAA